MSRFKHNCLNLIKKKKREEETTNKSKINFKVFMYSDKLKEIKIS